jgi:hypothetical protein
LVGVFLSEDTSMAIKKKPRTSSVRPRFPYYRSRNNGQVYAAMSYPAGYEDKHPDEFEPVTQFEFDAIKARNDRRRAPQAAAIESGNPGALGGALGALQTSQEADDDLPDDPYPEPEFVGTGAAPVAPAVVQLQPDEVATIPVATIPVAPLPVAAPSPAPAPPPPAPGALGGALGS